MPVSTLMLGVFCLFIYSADAWCEEGEIKNICDTHIRCNPDNMCKMCECYRDAWDCSYGGHGGCNSDQDRYLELGTIGDSKYIFSMRQKTFDNTREACKGQGGHLAVMERANETTALNALINAAPKWARSSDIYLGAYSDNKETWFWITGASLNPDDYPKSWQSWYFHNPYGEGPHCLVINPWMGSSRNIWRPTRCAYRNYYICEVPSTLVIPTLPGPPGLDELGSFGGSSYSLMGRERPWDAARRECQEDGGDLVVINSEEEWKFLLKAIKDHGEEGEIYMGASSPSGTDRPWNWIDGRRLHKSDRRWNWPQPNDTGRACLVLSGWRGEDSNWLDFDCSFTAKAVCEKSSPTPTMDSSK